MLFLGFILSFEGFISVLALYIFGLFIVYLPTRIQVPVDVYCLLTRIQVQGKENSARLNYW